MQDPTNEIETGRDPHRRARVPSRNPVRARRDANEGEASVVQGVEEVADGDRYFAARSMAGRATKRCPVLAGNRRWSSAEARACSVCVGIDDLMHGSVEKLVREMRQRK
jgi:hypothetical protein